MSEEKKTAAKKPAAKKDPKKAAAPKATKEATAEATPQAKTEPPAAGGWEVARLLKITKPLMKGNDVKALQTALIANNYHCGKDGVSGVYERHTAHAVRCFQSHKGLIVDGRAGKHTVAALGGVWKG